MCVCVKERGGGSGRVVLLFKDKCSLRMERKVKALQARIKLKSDIAGARETMPNAHGRSINVLYIFVLNFVFCTLRTVSINYIDPYKTLSHRYGTG